MPLFAWVTSELDWSLEEWGKRRREGASPFFRRPGARSAVVAEGAGAWMAVEFMVIALASIARQDHRLMSFIIDFATLKWIDHFERTKCL